MLSSSSGTPKYKIYVVDDYSLIVIGSGDVSWRHGRISNHLPIFSANLLLVAQFTHTGNTIEFWSYCFIIEDLKHWIISIAISYLDPKEQLYKLCDSLAHDSIPTALIAQTNKIKWLWHEQRRHKILKFEQDGNVIKIGS